MPLHLGLGIYVKQSLKQVQKFVAGPDTVLG